MHIVLISGSHRLKSQSARVARYLADRLAAKDVANGAAVTTDVIDLAGNPLPLWDEGAWQADSAIRKQWQPFSDRLKKADGLVVIAPEWAGMVPPGLKNFLLLCTPAEVGHKPALITTVSAARGGSYPVNELRTSGYKNTAICYIPEHLIVRDAEKMFTDAPDADNKDDLYLRGRADYALRCLLGYAGALKPVRESGVFADKRYPFGM